MPQLVSKKVKVTGKEIGHGAYGRVFEIMYEKTRYAAKVVHAILLDSAQSESFQKFKADFLNECHMWGQLQNTCIVQLIG